MAGFGGPFAYRDWVRSWNERLNRLEAYLRKQRAAGGETEHEHEDGPGPEDYRHRRN